MPNNNVAAGKGRMMLISCKALLAAAVLSIGVSSEFALAEAPAPATTQASAPTRVPTTQSADDHLVITDHAFKLGDRTLDYSATAGTLRMKDEAGKAKADLFFVAYTLKRDDGKTPSDRPVTFVFNGGPGAASVWLHLGIVGPKRIQLADEKGEPAPPPYRLADNPDTWLPFTDLVFIDPVNTGYSRAAAGEDPKQFFGVQQDIDAVGDFIRLYVTRYERWLSPKFLAGESYGTTRAAGLSSHLSERYGIDLNGIVLISTVLDFQTISVGPSNDLPYALYLPTYAAVALYHDKLAPELKADPKKTIADAEQFALGEYSTALLNGALAPERRAAVVKQVARFTGLSEDLVDRSDLRISPWLFMKHLLQDRRQIVGRFDGRLTGLDSDRTANSPEYDPSFSRYFGVYSATVNAYLRQDLRFESDLPYEVLSGRVQPWDYGKAGNGYLNTADDLRDAMIRHPHLRVLVASGHYDLATPYLATNYTLDHLNLGDLRKNLVQTYYEGGHMLYHHAPSATALTRDVSQFLQSSVKRPTTRSGD